MVLWIQPFSLVRKYEAVSQVLIHHLLGLYRHQTQDNTAPEFKSITDVRKITRIISGDTRFKDKMWRGNTDRNHSRFQLVAAFNEQIIWLS